MDFLEAYMDFNEAGLKAIKIECLLIKRGVGYHKPELGLGLASRQDLCDRLEARYGRLQRASA